jgi:outer membrane protein assembly factor BamB
MHGQANGNDGPFKDEAQLMGISQLEPTHGDILWRYEFAREHKIQAHDAYSSDPLIVGDLVIFATGHAKGRLHTPAWTKPKDIDKWKYEPKPNLIALNKETGEFVATDEVMIEQVFHGQWSSPSLVEVNGKPLIIWGSGYGILHAFALPEPGSDLMKEVWRCDLNTPEQRAHPFPDHGMPKDQRAFGPLHVIARPVIWKGKIFVSTGRDHYYTSRMDRGRIGTKGALFCIEPAGSGDITDTNVIWKQELYANQSTLSITDEGLAFVADGAGFLRCYNAYNGEELWVEDLGHDVTCRSQVVADGKVFVGDDKRGYHVFEASNTPKRLFEGRLDGLPAPISADDGMLIIATERAISAYGNSRPPQPEIEDGKL